jgi:molybdopterin synthase catalytic subunit
VKVEVKITTWPINVARAWPAELAGQAGAHAEFTGIVRSEEDGRVIAALEYEAYSPMAETVMQALIEELARQHPCLFVRVTHRVGLVPVGEAAIHVAAAAPHRAAALAMVAGFMNRLKQDVPIWKRRAFTAEELEARR